MKSFKELARKNFSEKFQWNRMLWTIALNVVKELFNIENPDENIVRETDIISWFLKYNVLFLRTNDQSLKIAIFRDKKKVITEINNHFHNLWYEQEVSEIRFTS
jgi:hypothetical protein